jgi:putative methyltransferase (TIGR04325 family)
MSKSLVKRLTPPIIFDFYRLFKPKLISTNKIEWKGNYSSWSAAAEASEGYDSELILEKVRAATLKVKSGEAVYERDSFIFEKVQYSWPVLAGLLRIAAKNDNCLKVIDFGGSLGTLFFQYKSFLNDCGVSLIWRIVEQDKFVQVGKNEVAGEGLDFYYTIDEALNDGFSPNVCILSGVLQCIENPTAIIHLISKYKIPNIILDRTAFTEAPDMLITIQTIPEWLYKASYPSAFFKEDELLQIFKENYRVIADFEDSFTFPITVDGYRCYWKGFLMELSNEK